MSAKKSSYDRLFLPVAVFGVVLIASVFAGSAFGQDFKRPDGSVPLPMDWSDSHLIYTVGATREQLSKAQSDPRYFVATRLHSNALAAESAAIGNPTLDSTTAASTTVAVSLAAAKEKKKPALNKDWSVSLGAGGVAQGMAPAKFSFDVNAAPDCTNDFAVFPVNASTVSTRAHVVGTFSTSSQYSSGTTVSLTVTPTVGTAATLTLTASTSSNTGLNFQVFTTGTITANATTEATNLAAAINRHLSTTISTELAQVVAVASTNTVTVYTLTPGNRVVLTDTNTLNNFSWGTVSSGTNGTQANIVGLNKLYSGTTSPFCTGLSYPEFTFSYASGTGPVATSPVLSLNGAQIAYVENDTSIGAILHVLTIGTGTEHGTCTNSGTALPTCATGATGPVIPGSTASSTATDIMLPLGAAAGAFATTYSATTGADSYSFPFVDYGNNTLYVGDNGGYLYAITGVFGGTPAYAGGNFPVTVSANELSAPVVDVSGTGDIFIGDSGGFLYNYSSGGTLEGTKLTLTANTGAGGVRDAPIVDSTNAVGYVVAGCDSAGTEPQLSQFAFTGSALTLSRTVDLLYPSAPATTGCQSSIPMYSPALNNNYYTQGISSGAITACTTNNNSGWYESLGTYGFTGSTMNSASYGYAYTGTISAAATCSPLTEFYGTSAPVAITALTQSGTTVTVTANNEFETGQSVTIAGVTSGGTHGCTSAAVNDINGTRTVTGSTATTVTFTASDSTTITSGCGLGSATATGPTDFLFYGTNIPEAFTFTLPMPSGNGSASSTATNTTSVTGGTSGMVIDNDSSDGQASSLYFGTLATSTSQCGTTAAYCAVKLTQAGLL